MRGPGSGPDQGWDWDEARTTCLRFARRYAVGHDADDIAQEAVIRAWRFRSTLESESVLESWLARIVHNEAARAGARSRPEPVANIDLALGVEDDQLENLVKRAELDEAMSHLDAGERHLLHLRYGRDLTQPAIAAAMDMPEGTVKVRLHRARAKLHQALSN